MHFPEQVWELVCHTASEAGKKPEEMAEFLLQVIFQIAQTEARIFGLLPRIRDDYRRKTPTRVRVGYLDYGFALGCSRVYKMELSVLAFRSVVLGSEFCLHFGCPGVKEDLINWMRFDLARYFFEKSKAKLRRRFRLAS